MEGNAACLVSREAMLLLLNDCFYLLDLFDQIINKAFALKEACKVFMLMSEYV